MKNITIQKVTLNDITALQHVGRKTFADTFADSNSEENMAKYLDEGFSSKKLTNELSNPDSQFYFAVQDKTIVGYLKLNTGGAQTELLDQYALEIERIYVLADYHGKSVGQHLYDKAMQVATALKASYVWLGVWEENLRAVRFYEKNGFVAFDKHVFKLGEDEQTDIMMKKSLKA